MPQKMITKEKTKGYSSSNLLIGIKVLPWAILVIILLLFASLNQRWWLFDIYVSFTPQILIVTVGLFIVLAALITRFAVRDGWLNCVENIGKTDAATIIITAAFTIYLFFYSILILSPIPASAEEHNLTVGTYNKLYTNESIEEAIRFFSGKQTDIVALQETTPEFVEEARKKLSFDYSYVTDCDCSAEDTEVAILSKHPLSNEQVLVEHTNGAIIRAEVQVDSNNRIAVYGLHIPPPYGPEWYNLRDDFINRLNSMALSDELESVIMGDFNATIFSPSMQDFISTSESTNTSQSSWPKCSWYGYTALACARIDHIFVSEGLMIESSETGELSGSDHKPLIANLNLL